MEFLLLLSLHGWHMDGRRVEGHAAWQCSGRLPWQLFPDPLGVPVPRSARLVQGALAMT